MSPRFIFCAVLYFHVIFFAFFIMFSDVYSVVMSIFVVVNMIFEDLYYDNVIF